MSRYDKKEKRTLAIFILIFILLAAGISISGYISYRNFEKQFRIQAGHQLSSIAELKVNNLVSWRDERLADTEILSQNLVFSALVQAYFENPADQLTQEQIRAWLKSYQVYPDYERVRLLDTQGQTRLSDPEELPPLSSAVAERLPEVLRSKKILMVDFYRRESDGQIHLSMIAPILDVRAGDQVIGFIAISIDPEIYLYPYIKEWPIDSTSAETLLVRRDGNNVLFLNELRFDPDTALTLIYPLTDTQLPSVKAVLGQTGVVQGLDYRGKSVLADVRRVPDSPWFLVSKMDVAEVDAPLIARLWQTLGLVGMAIFVAGAGLILVWRQQRIEFYRTQAAAAEALIVSETRYRRLFEAARDGILILDAETGIIVDVNPFLVEMLGFPREEFVGKELWELGFFKDIAANKDNFLELQQKEYIRYEDLPLETVNGRKFYVEFVSNVYQVNHHKVIQCNIRDITERKQADNMLRETNEYLDNLFNYANAPIIVWDPQFRITRFNHAFEELTGRSEHEVLGKSLEILFPPSEVESSMTFIRKTLTGERWEVVEINILHVDGSIHTVLWNSATLFSSDGKTPMATIAQGQEITERKQAERMIEARLRLVEFGAKHSMDEMLTKALDEVCDISGSPIGFYHFVEPDQKTLSLQAWSTRTMQEYCKAEGKGLHYGVDQAGVWVDCIRQRQAVIHNDYAALAHRQGLPEGHAELVRELVVPILRDGLIVAILGIGNKAQDYTEKDVDIANYFADVTWEIAERKRAEQQLVTYTEKLEETVTERTRELRNTQEQLVRQERLAMLGQLAGSIGHELRNPLGIISNAIYFLKVTQPNADDKIKEYLDIIENEMHTSDKIITDLLDFARIKSIEHVAVSVSDLIRQTLERFPVPASVEMTLEIPTDLSQVFVDPHQMTQVLGNLIVNAYQSLPAMLGRLNISAALQADMISIAVHDNGMGIPLENINKLFEPLFTTKIKGIGLGLAVSKKLIEANGGRIEVQSEAGEGSTFTIWLPVHNVTASDSEAVSQ